jgi:hypothetical protein
MAGNRPINPDGPGTTGTGKPKRPKQFPRSTPTAEGFLKPFANETYRRAYKKTQVQNERSGAKPVVKAANKERELQRIAARQRLKGDKFATVNSAKKQYKKRAKRFAEIGPKTDTTVGTRQRGFYNDTMDTSLNPLGGGPRPTQNRYLNTWESPETASPKRPAGVSRKPKIVPFSTMSPTDTSTRVSSSGYVDVAHSRLTKNLFKKSDPLNTLVKTAFNIAASGVIGKSWKKQDGTYDGGKVQNIATPNNSFTMKRTLPFHGKRGTAGKGTRRTER